MREIEKTKVIGFFFKLLIFSGGLFFTATVFAQDLPKEIRGYKVYKAKVAVRTQSQKSGSSKSSENAESEAFVKVSAPKLTEISLTGVTLAISAEIEASAQSGKVDFLTFYDFRVNGLAVDIEEYKESFEFKKNRVAVLPKPIVIFVGAGQTLRGALAEVTESLAEWTVTGRIFVFGRFKKAGFNFKRVVPVEINLKIENPLQ